MYDRSWSFPFLCGIHVRVFVCNLFNLDCHRALPNLPNRFPKHRPTWHRPSKTSRKIITIRTWIVGHKFITWILDRSSTPKNGPTRDLSMDAIPSRKWRRDLQLPSDDTEYINYLFYPRSLSFELLTRFVYMIRFDAIFFFYSLYYPRNFDRSIVFSVFQKFCVGFAVSFVHPRTESSQRDSSKAFLGGRSASFAGREPTSAGWEPRGCAATSTFHRMVFSYDRSSIISKQIS